MIHFLKPTFSYSRFHYFIFYGSTIFFRPKLSFYIFLASVYFFWTEMFWTTFFSQKYVCQTPLQLANTSQLQLVGVGVDFVLDPKCFGPTIFATLYCTWEWSLTVALAQLVWTKLVKKTFLLHIFLIKHFFWHFLPLIFVDQKLVLIKLS